MAEVVRYVNTASLGGDGTTNLESGTSAAYVSLAVWEAGEQTNLVTATDTHVVNCTTGSGSAADTAVVNIAGWTVSSTYNIRVEAAATDRAGFVWDTDKYRLHVTHATAGSALHLSQSWIEVFGMQIRNSIQTNVTYSAAIRQPNDHSSMSSSSGHAAVIDSCYLWNEVITSTNITYTMNAVRLEIESAIYGGDIHTVRNCIMRVHTGYAFDTPDSSSRARYITVVQLGLSWNGEAYVYNNIIHAHGRGGDSGRICLGISSSFNTTAGGDSVFSNNYIVTGGSTWSTRQDIQDPTPYVYSTNCKGNATNDGTYIYCSDGSNFQAAPFPLVGGNYESYDYRFNSPTGPLVDAGVDLSAVMPALDMIGSARGSSWDVGAQEDTTVIQELEGFQWRNDDGDEIAASAVQNQDVTAARIRGVPMRLRAVLNAKKETIPDGAKVELRYRKKGSSDSWQTPD